MPTLQKVLPGDLIRSDLINQIIDSITALEGKLAALEGVGPSTTPGKLTISGVLSDGPIRPGDDIRVLGRNFANPVVTVASQRVDANKVTLVNDSLLIVSVPPLSGLSSQGNTVTLTVSNAIDFAATTITVFPVADTIPRGDLFVTLEKPLPSPINPPEAVFIFKVLAFTNVEDRYTLTPKVTPAQAGAGWSATVVDDSNQAINPELRIPASPQPNGTTQKVRVLVGIPNIQNGKASLTLQVKSRTSPSFSNTSADASFDIGGQVSGVDPDIQVSFSKVFPPATGGATGVQVPVTTDPNQPVKVQVDFGLTLVNAGKYTLTPRLESDPNTLWNAKVKGVSEPDVPANFTGIASLVLFALANAPQTRVILKVASKADANKFTEFPLNISLK